MDTEARTTAVFPRERERIADVALLGMAALVAGFAIDGGFVYDDGRALFQNPVVNGELPALAAFVRDYWGGALDGPVRSYRPLLPLLWHWIWQVAPGQALPFRLFTLLFHVAATASVLRLLRRALPDRMAALAGGALFAMHPVHAEALGAIVAQSDVLSAALGALALGAILDDREKPGSALGWARALGAALLLLLACLAKETSVVFGVAIAAVVWARAPRGDLRALAAALPASIVVAAVVAAQLSFERTRGGVMPGSLAASLSGAMRLLYGLHSIGHGSSLLLIPTGLCPNRGYAAVQPTFGSLGPFALVGLGVVALWGRLLARGLRARDGVLLAALALWAGPLIIQSGFVVTPITDVADRLLYTPSIVACGALGLWLAQRSARPGVQRALLPALIAACVMLSFEAQRAWVSDYALWRRAVEVEPRSWTNQKNYAAQLALHDNPQLAAWHFLLSLYIVRQYPHPIDWTAADALAQKPLEVRLIEGPGVLEPEKACQLSKAYLGNMRRSAPDVVRALEPVHQLRYCERR